MEERTSDVSLLLPLQILSRCDLCLIQEVRDSKGEAIQALVKDLNRSGLVLQKKNPSVEISSQNIDVMSADLTNRTHTRMWKVSGWDGRATRSNTSTFTGIYRCERTFGLHVTLTSSRSSLPQEQLAEGQRALSAYSYRRRGQPHRGFLQRAVHRPLSLPDHTYVDGHVKDQCLAAADAWSLAVVKDFVLIGQHTCPRSAVKEIDQLYAVFKGIQREWKMDVSQSTNTCLQLKAPSWASSAEGPSSSALLQWPRTW